MTTNGGLPIMILLLLAAPVAIGIALIALVAYGAWTAHLDAGAQHHRWHTCGARALTEPELPRHRRHHR